MKTKIVSCHTADSKPVKQEVNGTVILPPLVFPGVTLNNNSLGEQGDEGGGDGDAGRRAVLPDRPGREVDVNVLGPMI
jgi:hypothetical protein